ncbi:MAG: hypothetical protein ACOYJE_00095 [Bacteroidaceae bacterium]|jgi:hypothetical protein
MSKNFLFVCLTAVAFTLFSCDDGPIERAESTPHYNGFAAKVTGHVSGTDSWPEYYQVVLAGFDESEYATAQVLISPAADGSVAQTLPNLGSTVKTVELCVTNTLRRRIITFKSIDVSALQGDTLYLDAGTVDVNMFNSIQTEIFDNNCAHCHGGTGTAAGGLFLTEGRSYAELVNQPSQSVPDSTRVIPYNAEWSILHQILLSDEVLNLPVTHGDILNDQNRRLIDEWINAGAKE